MVRMGCVEAALVLWCRESLEFAARHLAGFGVPRALVTGNHDLEGEDFDTDEANLAAWQQVKPHCKAAVPAPCDPDARSRDLDAWCVCMESRNDLMTTMCCLPQIIGQRHYWAAELGNTVCIGLSTVRFRSNKFRQGQQPHFQISRRFLAAPHAEACG